MKQIETQIIIHALPEQVWAVLMDFQSYSKWNPFVRSISGGNKAGETLRVSMKVPDGMQMTIGPQILNADLNKEFRWKGKLMVSGLFDGEHYFKLIDLGDGRTQFIHGEYFSGILVGLFGSLLAKTKTGFELMNKALKVRCEQPGK